MNHVLSPVLIPVIAAALILIIRRMPGIVALIASVATLLVSLNIFSTGESMISYDWLPFGVDFSLRAYNFSSVIVIVSSVITTLVVLFSCSFMKEQPGSYRMKYYFYILLNTGFVNGTILSNNLITLLFFWEATLIMLYALINTGRETATAESANKAFLTVGFGDFCLMLGVLLFWYGAGNVNISKIPYQSPALTAAFILMVTGAIAKAGAMPFHNWIPDASNNTPPPVMALLPSAVDKLLSVYFLVRISTEMFVITKTVGLLLMVVGSVTIVFAGFMAIIQKDVMRLLSYSTVSQAGYMLLGIGTGNPVGIVGGLFHMLNNVIYKTSLFLCGGIIQKKAGTLDLNKLGGYAKTMPVTFVSFLVAALAISGIPPLNGFFSKWMIYQSVIESSRYISKIWWIFLIAAMFGSAISLAAFMKLTHAIFWGQSEPGEVKKGETHWTMLLPVVLLSALCVLFGIFAVQVPLQKLLIPALTPEIRYAFDSGKMFSGLWRPLFGAAFLILGLLLGIVIYLLGKIHPRETETYIGGEKMSPDMHVSGAEFYQTVSDMPLLNRIYSGVNEGTYNFYNWGVRIARSISRMLFIGVDRLIDRTVDTVTDVTLNVGRFVRLLHGGFLSVYLFWSLLGLMILLLILMR